MKENLYNDKSTNEHSIAIDEDKIVDTITNSIKPLLNGVPVCRLSFILKQVKMKLLYDTTF